MHGTTSPVNPPAPAPLPASSPSSTQAVNPRLSLPERFDGTPAKCKRFLLQCSLFLNQQPSLYPTDINQVSFICSLLWGRALEWATAVWEGSSLSFPPLNEFLRQFREIFEHSVSGEDAGEQLLALRQGKDTAADYSLTFRTLAAQTGWGNGPLKLLYQKGLLAELQSELACRDEGRTLEEFINITIRLDNLLRSRRSPLASGPTTVSEPKPMHIGITRLSSEEKERRFRNHLCLYCGQSGHLRVSCPTRPPTKSTFSVSPCSNTLMVPISLSSSGVAVETTALIDSGAAGNFIDINFANSHNLPLVTCETRLGVTALDGWPLGPGLVQFKTQVLTLRTGSLHIERICLFAIDSPQNLVILGLPWLEKHNPRISWSAKQIQQWSEFCHQECLQFHCPDVKFTPSPDSETPSTKNLPVAYQDLSEAFSRSKASQLPPHRSSDCAIDLLPGAMPTKCRVFPLSQPESEAMRAYIEEELASYDHPLLQHQPGSSLWKRKTEVYVHALTTEVWMTSPLSSVTRYRWFLLLSNNYAQPDISPSSIFEAPTT